MRSLRPRPRVLGLYALSAFVAFLVCAPFVWMLSTAFKPPDEIFAKPPTVLPRRPTGANFTNLFRTTRFVPYFVNSTVVGLAVVVLTVVVAAPGAYSLTRFHYRGRHTIGVLALMTYMLAPIVIVIPLYLMVRTVGFQNTLVGLVLAQAALCFPFSLWLLRSFFVGIPIDYEEAAMTDGAGRVRAIWHVVLPLAFPGVMATSIFTFIISWNEYLFARILITADTLKTLPVGIQDLYYSSVIDWGMFMAAGTMITLPVLAVFVFVQRYLIEGWGTGGIKG